MTVDKSLIPSEKHFDGKEYTAYGAYPNLRKAKQVAQKLKKEAGHYVRIVHFVRAKGYAVYVRVDWKKYWGKKK